MAAAETLLSIELAYALPLRQTLIRLQVPPACSLREAILQSGVLERHPEIDLQQVVIGVFSRIAALDDPLHEGDRIEIYRPLVADPKEVRRRRAARARRERSQAG